MQRYFRHVIGLISVIIAIAAAGCASDKVLVNTNANAQDRKTTANDPQAALQVSDISIPPGAKLDAEKSLVIGTGERWLGRLVIKTDISSVHAYNHFFNGMPAIGWSLIAAIQSNVSQLTYLRGERVVIVQIESGWFGGTTITISASPRQSSGNEAKAAR
ncbi:hypothetical protein [Propionivibrio dicarboxylicus]|uniref:Uncharacterized protein n=1 Tax=Propionivibrio dicarboxylicus TaxID=83767 RepID=A0A1G8MNG2_9RHOO|nr:hypothetical protein [Propionivibrio dicarboxylicus]SDI69396.1 hypothetical protein SAMN05660652_03877 [Propionivibrio dicarboxylicus]